jgi:mannose-6-phosphate isomerase-like protein (cupin superfamily)
MAQSYLTASTNVRALGCLRNYRRREAAMAAYGVKKIDEMEGIGPGGVFKLARAELGLSSFGMAVIEMPPNADQYPEHSHSEDGQEEVYIALRGSGEVEVDGTRHQIDENTMISVGPGVPRKVWTADEPLRVLVIGGCPGKPYEAPGHTELGAGQPIPGL